MTENDLLLADIHWAYTGACVILTDNGTAETPRYHAQQPEEVGDKVLVIAHACSAQAKCQVVNVT